MSVPSEADAYSRSSRLRRWFPLSWSATALFLLLATAMVIPALVAFFMALVFSNDCFLTSCPGPQPGSAVVSAVLGVLFVLAPFAGVRVYQGNLPSSRWARVAVLAVAVLPVVCMGRLFGIGA